MHGREVEFLCHFSQERGDDGDSDEREEEDGGRAADPTGDDPASLLCPGPPIYLPQRERLAREREVCFIPSTLPGQLANTKTVSH